MELPVMFGAGTGFTVTYSEEEVQVVASEKVTLA